MRSMLWVLSNQLDTNIYITQIDIKIKSTTPSKWCPWHNRINTEPVQKGTQQIPRQNRVGTSFWIKLQYRQNPGAIVKHVFARSRSKRYCPLEFENGPYSGFNCQHERVVNTGVSLFFFPALTDRLKTASKYLILPVKWVFSSQIQI